MTKISNENMLEVLTTLNKKMDASRARRGSEQPISRI